MKLIPNKKVQVGRNQTSELDRIVCLEEELSTCKYQLTKLFTQVDLMCKWIKNKYGVEFQFGVLDKVVLDFMQDGNDLETNSVVSGEAGVDLMRNSLGCVPTDDDQCQVNSTDQETGASQPISEGGSMDSRDVGVAEVPTLKKLKPSNRGNSYLNLGKTVPSSSPKETGLKRRREKKKAKSSYKTSAGLHSSQGKKKYKFDKNGNKYYSCGWNGCMKRFKFSYDLTRHLRRHKGIKPYACTWNDCTKPFCTKSDLKRHLTTHTGGEKKFKCDALNCGKSFGGSYDLIRHKRIHTGEKPFTCIMCDRMFGDRSTLLVHIRRLHTNEKSFECEKCDKVFSCSAGLWSHNKFCHT